MEPGAAAHGDTPHHHESGTEECEHLAAHHEPFVTPNTPEGCADCLREGTTWVHLRLCLACGNVGCCNSSPERHAARHHHATGHQVIRSLEPGEDWRWCFEHQLLA